LAFVTPRGSRDPRLRTTSLNSGGGAVTMNSARCHMLHRRLATVEPHHSCTADAPLAVDPSMYYIQAVHLDSRRHIRIRASLPSTRCRTTYDTSSRAHLSLACRRLSDPVFSVAGLQVWNRFPASLRNTVCAATFEKHLKTFLCMLCFIFSQHYTSAPLCILHYSSYRC